MSLRPPRSSCAGKRFRPMSSNAKRTSTVTRPAKPANIIEKIIEGQVGKFYGEVCLLEQSFVKDPDKTIQQVLKTAGADVTVTRFARFVLGEGLEKKESDFAAEVAAAAGN